MTKDEFKEKIRTLVKQVYSKSTSDEVDLDNPLPISLESDRFPVLTKFPTLKDTIIKLLTDQYELFVSDIEWVAPRPTTFRIILANEQPFYLIYTDRSWIGKVEGKKYYLLNLSEEQNCIEAIARILAYGTKAKKEEGGTTSTSTSTETTSTETTPTSTETTPTGGETPTGGTETTPAA